MKKHTRQKNPRTTLLAIRLTSILKERLRKVERRTHVPVAILVLESLSAVCDYVEQHGELRLPFRMMPRKELEALRAKAARRSR